MSAVVVMETITKSPLFEEDEVVQRPGTTCFSCLVVNDVYIDFTDALKLNNMGADCKCKSKNYERACVFEHSRL